jgi:hypothetical protein
LETSLLLGFLQFVNEQIEILFSLNGSKNGVTSANLVRKEAMPRAFSLPSNLQPFTFIALESTFFNECFPGKWKALRLLSVFVNCYSVDISLSEAKSAEASFSRVSRLLHCLCEAVEEIVKVGCERTIMAREVKTVPFAELSDDHRKARNDHGTEL